jgi:hypothetical protein
VAVLEPALELVVPVVHRRFLDLAIKTGILLHWRGAANSRHGFACHAMLVVMAIRRHSLETSMRKMIMMALAGLLWKQFQTKVMKRPVAQKKTWRY